MITKTQPSESSASTRSYLTDEVIVQAADGTEKYGNVADAAQIQDNRIQVVYLNGESELVEGEIFGTWRGDWTLWLDTGQGILKVDPAEGPMTFPHEIRFGYDGRDHQRAGQIKRLKRHDL